MEKYMYINSVGFYIPEKRIGADYFTAINGLTEDWIYPRTGILTRARASEQETLDYMCDAAVRQASQNLPYDIAEVDLIVFASYTPSDTIATTGYVVQKAFNLYKAKVLYLSAACSSAINAIELIQSFFIAQKASRALLICGERNSSFSDDSDKASGHLWGDGAAAYFFSDEQLNAKEPEILDVDSQGLGHIGFGPTAVTLNTEKGKLEMPFGRDVFIHSCHFMAENTKKILDKNKCCIDDLAYFIGHQANQRILNNVVEQLGLPEKKVLSNIREVGNTGSVSALLVFAQHYTDFKSGDLICISVFGGGYSSGTCLIRL